MIYRLFKKILIFSLWIGLVQIVSVSAGVKGDVKKTFKVEEGGILTVEADIGSINVRTQAGKNVDVEILFERQYGSRYDLEDLLEDFDVDFQHVGKNVTVFLEYDQYQRNFWNRVGKYLRVRFRIAVPEKYNVNLKTSGGSISVDNLQGDVNSQTSGGSLEFGSITGEVYGRTSGGSIVLAECKGEVDVKTSGGSINIGKVAGNVLAKTSGGAIHVDEVMGSIEAATSGGSVTAKITKQPEHDCTLQTSGGGITVYLASDIGVDLNAGTSGGRVRTDFPVTVRGEINKHSLRTKINNGGPKLYLRTSGGSISIKEL